MAQRSHLALTILLVPGLLKRILSALRKLAQALKVWVFRRLSHRTIPCLGDGASTHKKESKDEKLPPESSVGDSGRSAVAEIGKSVEGTFDEDTTSSEDFEYHPVVDGERISLHNIMPSLSPYPLAGGGIRNPSASTRSLASSLSAHSRAVADDKERTPGHSLRGSSIRTGSFSSMNISIVAPQSPDPQSIPNGSILIPVVPGNLSPNADQSRPPSPREDQDRNYSSDNYVAHDGMPIPSINALETRQSSQSSLQDVQSSPVADSGVDVSTNIGNLPNARVNPPEQAGSLEPIPFPIPHIDIHVSMGPPKLHDHDIAPIMPESIGRYAQRPQIRHASPQPPITPLTTKFGDRYCNGWEICLHPEGARYFYNREKRIYIEGDVVNFDRQIKQVVDVIEGFVHQHNIREAMDENTELVVWLRTPTVSNPYDRASACYYFVHHTTRTIFFLDNFEPKALQVVEKELPTGPTSQQHLGVEIEAQYWFHCQLFPHSLRLTKGLVEELRGTVLHFIGDTATCPKGSTAPFHLDDLYKILSLIAEIEKYVDTGYTVDPYVHSGLPGHVGASSCFARHMFVFCRARFLHFHGEPHARLERTTSVYGGDPHQRTILIKTISWALFFAPDFHLRDLQNMWVDGITQRSIFQSAVLRMNDQWAQMTLMATVFLAVDVSFWSIQSNNINQGANRTPAQIFSYLSASACISSIVIGMLLLLQNQTKMRETADDFEEYMRSWNHPYMGLETLAILHSMPFALLMWGIMFFSLAVSCLCFMDASIPTRVTIGIAVFVSLTLVSSCVWAHWDKEKKDENPEWLELPNSVLLQNANGPNMGGVYPAINVVPPGHYEMSNFGQPPIDPNQQPNHFLPEINVGGIRFTPSIQSLRSYFFPEQRSSVRLPR